MPSVGNYQYLACYTEGTASRALDDLIMPVGGATLTVAQCAAACKTYAYFGVEYSQECYCGNELNAGSVVAPGGSSPAANGCSMTCAGNPNEYCGGPNRLNVYKLSSPSSTSSRASTTSISSSQASTTTSRASTTSSQLPTTTTRASTTTSRAPTTSSQTSTKASSSTLTSSSTVKTSSSTTSKTAGATPTVYPGDDTFDYAGCYVDSVGARALPKQPMANNQMTVESCLSACSQYTYAGIEYGR